MKILSKEIKTLFIAIFTICITFVSPSFAEEMSNGQAHRASLYNPDAEEQSVLFTFLHTRMFLKNAANIIETDGFCDYCKLRDNYKLKFSAGFPEFLKELGFSHDDSPESSNSNCNMCELSKKLPFESLDKDLNTKLNELCRAELYLLKEQDSGIAEEVNELLDGFDYDSEEELVEQIALYRELYSKVEKIGNYPNLLDKISLLITVTNDILVFMQAKEEAKDSSGVRINLHFAQNLAFYKKFLYDHNELLLAIENISIGFQDTKVRKIETLSEILVQAEKWLGSEKALVEERLRDIL